MRQGDNRKTSHPRSREATLCALERARVYVCALAFVVRVRARVSRVCARHYERCDVLKGSLTFLLLNCCCLFNSPCIENVCELLAVVARRFIVWLQMLCKIDCISTVVCSRYIRENLSNCPMSLVARPGGSAEAAPKSLVLWCGKTQFQK